MTMLTTDGQAAKADGSNSIIGVWATTWRRQTRVLSANGYGDNQTGDWVQIERLGNPLVNEVVVPLGVKDHFNATPPSGDGAVPAGGHQPRAAGPDQRAVRRARAAGAAQRPGHHLPDWHSRAEPARRTCRPRRCCA